MVVSYIIRFVCPGKSVFEPQYSEMGTRRISSIAISLPISPLRGLHTKNSTSSIGSQVSTHLLPAGYRELKHSLWSADRKNTRSLIFLSCNHFREDPPMQSEGICADWKRSMEL